MDKWRTINAYWKWIGGIWVGIILVNVVAWFSPLFCDFYVTYIFPIWVATYGRVTGLFPFSVGEWLLYLAVLYLAMSLLMLPFGIAVLVKRKRGCMQEFDRSLGQRVGKFICGWLKIVPLTVTLVCVLMTLNCTILYHCSPLERQIVTHEQRQADGPIGYDGNLNTTEKLLHLREYIVAKCNELAQKMFRDENGNVVYEGDMKSDAIVAMRGLSDEFPRLSGFYPNPKPLYASWFYSQQYICGYYFPFSMEANYNDIMYIMNKPASMCHELAHLKGYIYEDEANFLAYLACVESGNDFLAYSGYLSVLYYVEEDVIEVFERLEASGEIAPYGMLTPITEQVIEDSRFLTKEAWEEVEEISMLDTETVSEVADDFLEANLSLNGVAEGVDSYSRVVELLLLYYD